jgi:hypothetical protein
VAAGVGRQWLPIIDDNGKFGAPPFYGTGEKKTRRENEFIVDARHHNSAPLPIVPQSDRS